MANMQSVLLRAKNCVTPSRTIVVLTAVLAVVGILIAEKITIADGFGWDGVLYGTFAQDFWGSARAGISQYHVGRLAPSFVVHYALQAFSVPFTKANTLLGFEILDALLLIGSAWLWTRVARRLRLGPIGLWFGFIGAFANFFPLKHVSFYPAQTDVAAYFLGWAMLAAYLRGSVWLLIVSTMVGRFTWPTALPLGAILLLFPRSQDAGSNDQRASNSSLSWRAGVLAVLPALGVGACVVHLMARNIQLLNKSLMVSNHITDIFRPAWPLSLACSCAFLTAALFLLLRNSQALLEFRTYLKFLARWSTYAKLAFLVGLAMASKLLATGVPDPMSVSGWIQLSAWSSAIAPLKFLVAHADYYGPTVIVLVLGWRAVARTMGEAGPALTLVAVLAILMSLDSESRHLVNLIPFLVAFAAKAVDTQGPSKRTLGIFAVLSILASRVWLVIGNDVWLFLSNFGPWMSLERYALDSAVLLGLAFWCARSGIVPRIPPIASPAQAQRSIEQST
jgi:hypothetical protein